MWKHLGMTKNTQQSASPHSALSICSAPGQHSALGSPLHLLGHRARFLLEKFEIEQRNGNQCQGRGADCAEHHGDGKSLEDQVEEHDEGADHDSGGG